MHVLKAAWAWTLARSAKIKSWAEGPRSRGPHDDAQREAERGQTMAEYSLILSFVAISAIVSLAALGSVTNGMFWEPINRMLGEVVGMIIP